MTTSELLRALERYCGQVQESDLEDLVVVVRKSTNSVVEVAVTVDETCDTVTFADSNEVAVVVTAGMIVGARWEASGSITEGDLTASY